MYQRSLLIFFSDQGIPVDVGLLFQFDQVVMVILYSSNKDVNASEYIQDINVR